MLIVRALFEEYAAGLEIDLCFQGFREELETLPGRYAPPTGRLLLAWVGNEPGGCVGVRQIGEGICEMKRLYVRATARGHGVGRALAERIIDAAREIGYARMVLDTLRSMQAANALYESLGFCDCPPYSLHPVEGTRCMALELSS